MSTRSTIAILNLDGSVKAIFAHWDGYVSGNGLKLYLYYQDVNKVKELISLGSISSLKANLHSPVGVKHNFDKPDINTTVFYGRDKGERDIHASEFSSLDEYVKNGNFQEYDYVFNEKKNKWFLLDTENGKLKVLETIIKNDENVSDNVKQSINAKKQAKKLERDLKKKHKVIKNKAKI